MKKTIIFLICLFLIIVTSIYAFYQSRQSEVASISKFNHQYEIYMNRELKANDIVTLINKVSDENKKLEANDAENLNGIVVMLKFQDVDKVYEMSDLLKAGLDKFRESFEYSTFKVVECTYNSYKKIEKILIEEISYGNI